MIYISSNTITDVPFTLFEKTTYTGLTGYVMQLFSNQNHDNTYFWLTGDTTTNNARYNYFPINLSPYNVSGGTYDYFVYQSTASTATTIVVSALTVNNIVESGLCTVIAPPISTGTTYNNPKQEFTFY